MGVKRAKGRNAGKETGLVVEGTPGSSLPLEEFRRLASAGLFQRIVLSSDWTHFMVKGVFEGGGYAMLAMSKEQGVRRFLNPATALVMLRRMGVIRVELEMREWDLDMASLSMRMRPDVTARLLQRRRAAYQELLPGAKKVESGEAARKIEQKSEREDERWRLAESKMRRMFVDTGPAESVERPRAKRPSVELDGINAREISDRFLRETFGFTE
jgi:hypothetical protein